jgi:two-component system, NarL family, nitrate/nitrite response regulator NarL
MEPLWTVPIGTILVGPNVLLREGLARILSAADFRILASAPGLHDLLLSSLPQQQSLLLIIDVSDDFSAALEQIESFKQLCLAGRVVVLAYHHELREMVSAFRAGANAYLVKVASCDTFIKSLELVIRGVTLLPPEFLTFIPDRQECSRSGDASTHDRHVADDEDDADDGHVDYDNDDDDGQIVGMEVGTNEHAIQGNRSCTPRLSPRQQSILRCLIHGDSNKAIARKMALAEATVKVHVKAILRKIRVRNRTQAAIWAMSNGWFVSAEDDASPHSGKLPAEPFPSVDVGQVVSAGHKNGSTLSPTLRPKGASQVDLPSVLGLVRKGICRKND